MYFNNRIALPWLWKATWRFADYSASCQTTFHKRGEAKRSNSAVRDSPAAEKNISTSLISLVKQDPALSISKSSDAVRDAVEPWEGNMLKYLTVSFFVVFGLFVFWDSHSRALVRDRENQVVIEISAPSWRAFRTGAWIKGNHGDLRGGESMLDLNMVDPQGKVRKFEVRRHPWEKNIIAGVPVGEPEWFVIEHQEDGPDFWLLKEAHIH
jgi:hypothetical protein